MKTVKDITKELSAIKRHQETSDIHKLNTTHVYVMYGYGQAERLSGQISYTR